MKYWGSSAPRLAPQKSSCYFWGGRCCCRQYPHPLSTLSRSGSGSVVAVVLSGMFKCAVRPLNSVFNTQSRSLRLLYFSCTEEQFLEGWENIATAFSVVYIRGTWGRWLAPIKLKGGETYLNHEPEVVEIPKEKTTRSRGLIRLSRRWFCRSECSKNGIPDRIYRI